MQLLIQHYPKILCRWTFKYLYAILVGMITIYYWKATLCPQFIHPLATLLCSFVGVVAGRFPPTKSTAATVGWLILQHNQILLLHSHPLICLGEVLHHQPLLVQAKSEDNHGYRLLFSPHQITPLTVFLCPDKPPVHLINIRPVPITPLAHLATSRTRPTCTAPQHNNSPFIINPLSSHRHKDSGLNNRMVFSQPVLPNPPS